MFSLCFFHSIIIERKKFGPQGWNKDYPFNMQDLRSCALVANNYLESAKIPWDDLRYIFGEIMYGGHITDDWDRRLCNAYLRKYCVHEILEGLELCPGCAAAHTPASAWACAAMFTRAHNRTRPLALALAHALKKMHALTNTLARMHTTTPCDSECDGTSWQV